MSKSNNLERGENITKAPTPINSETGTNRKLIITAISAGIIVIIAIIVAVSLSGRFSKEEQVQQSNSVQADTSAETDAKEEIAVEETIQEDVATEEVQQQEVKQTLDEWVNSLDISEIKYCLWNETTSEGIVLENNQDYEMKEGDVILIYKPEGEGIETMTTPENSELDGVDVNDRYNILNLKFNTKVLFHTEITSKSGTEYKFNFVINPVSGKEAIDIDGMTGEEWAANSLVSINPEFVIWNDITGTKKEIANGEEYQFEEGDVIAIYYGYSYLLKTMDPMITDVTFEYKYAIINYTPNGSRTEFKAQLIGKENEEDVVEINFTLI